MRDVDRFFLMKDGPKLCIHKTICKQRLFAVNHNNHSSHKVKGVAAKK